jgi:hypothetical protein
MTVLTDLSDGWRPSVECIERMRIVLDVFGVVCLVVGCVWILQGINILPGSFMTGQTKWAIYGGILVVAGIGLLISANRRRV